MPTVETWTDAEIANAIATLRSSQTVADAVAQLPSHYGRRITTDSLKAAFRSRGVPSPSNHLARFGKFDCANPGVAQGAQLNPFEQQPPDGYREILDPDGHRVGLVPDTKCLHSCTSADVSYPRFANGERAPILAESNDPRDVRRESASGQGGPQNGPTCQTEPVRGQEVPVGERSGKAIPADVQRLVDAIRHKPHTHRELCDRFDLSPKRLDELIARAQLLGVQVDMAHDTVAMAWPVESQTVIETSIAPVVGDLQRVAVFSDTHFGSRYCLRKQIGDFARYAFDEGCRDFLFSGDLLDGCYHHGTFEVTHSGIESQTADAIEHLPQLPGVTYSMVTGNHCDTFAEKSGINVGRYIESAFRDAGRDDVRFVGDRSAFLRVRGAVVHLWHPRSGKSYARSYQLQKQVESYTAIKPQVLCAGHWHMFDWCDPRNVQAIAVPCFQGGQSAFGKSLPGAPSIGGLILEWRVTEHGTLRDFAVRRRTYYEREAIVQVRNELDAEPIEPVNAVARVAS